MALTGGRAIALARAGVDLSVDTDRCLRPRFREKPRKNGYWDVTFDGRNTYLHRLILELNEGDTRLPSTIQARHRCGNKWCVNRHHIVAGSIVQNMADQYALGERVMNERHPNCRLSTADAKAIKSSPRTVTSRELAKTHGVTASYINEIRAGTKRQFLDTGVRDSRERRT